jgi:hypothetical protein
MEHATDDLAGLVADLAIRKYEQRELEAFVFQLVEGLSEEDSSAEDYIVQFQQLEDGEAQRRLLANLVEQVLQQGSGPMRVLVQDLVAAMQREGGATGR